MGTFAGMKEYVDHMVGEMAQRWRCEENGIDQGVHNVLVRRAERAGAWWACVCARFVVLTRARLQDRVSGAHQRGRAGVHGRVLQGPAEVRRGRARAERGGEGGLLVRALAAAPGSRAVVQPYAVLHQYDRHQELTKQLLALWSERLE